MSDAKGAMYKRPSTEIECAMVYDEERDWPARSFEDEAWLDAVAFGRGIFREPLEILASRDPGRAL